MAADATLPFVIVDAFTSVRFGGNPAAVVVLPREEPGKRRHAPPPDGIKWEYGVMPASHELSGRDGWPPDLFLQDVAREMNLSETAFVREKLDRRRTVGRGDNEELFADYDLRWFTPSGAEVDLCGHATLASAHALWDTARVAPFAVIRFHTRSGILPVVPLGEGAAELNFPSAAPNMLLLGAPPEAVRAPPRAPLGSNLTSDDDDDDDDDDAPNNPAGVTPETVAAALGLSDLRADVDGEPTGDVVYPIVAGRNSVGDTFAVYPDPAHVLAARPPQTHRRARRQRSRGHRAGRRRDETGRRPGGFHVQVLRAQHRHPKIPSPALRFAVSVRTGRTRWGSSAGKRRWGTRRARGAGWFAWRWAPGLKGLKGEGGWRRG